MNAVSLSGVTRQWDGQGGVRTVTLDVAEGSFVSILGPSGCGKSTLLRLIAGLESPQAGAISIAGADVTAAPASQRGLSMVFQSYALFPHLNVAENVQFGLKVRRMPRPDREKRLGEAIDMMGLGGLERRKPAELSGGQRQRVALARAVVAGHPLCLMDEPLSNLDAKLRNSVRRDIKALQRRLDLTVIYVTHDQSEAMSLSDKVVLMRDGSIEQQGTPAELYATPASLFAAAFIGEPPMASIAGDALGLSQQVRVGVRPEQISPITDKDADLVATVADCEFLGGETRVLLEHPAADGLSLTLPGSTSYLPGQRLGIHIPEQSRVLFDAQTGKLKKDPQQNYGTDSRQTVSRDGRKAPTLNQLTD
ncbi:ABC transporter ATP-binding protein [Oricola sp.]|uniref:ABC transporter ATP-binding protein n=1 Tax=Oricola sp. TaxID=1979950 RepID=UPI003BAD8C12